MKSMLPLLILIASCAMVKDIAWEEIIKICKEAYDECKQDCECQEPTLEPTIDPEPSIPPVIPIPTPEPTTELDFFIPRNCNNPPKHILANDGFKCMGSATRGGSVVCLLPYQFTWKPHKMKTDHHNNTFACNKNNERFDEVDLILKSDKVISLKWAGCHNYVATVNGKIGRQHWRDESTKWDSVKNRVKTIVMKKGNKKTCLKF